MDKKEILEKSRAENKNQDFYMQEVIKQADNYAVWVMMVIATIFFIVQFFVGGGINCGIYALLFSATMTNCWVKYVKLRRKRDLRLAIVYTIIVLAMSGYHIYNLIISSAIL